MVFQVLYIVRGCGKFIPKIIRDFSVRWRQCICLRQQAVAHTHSASVLFHFVSAVVAKSKELSLLVGIFNCTFI